MSAYRWVRRMTAPLDVLIKNTTIVDGTGRPRYTADIGITGQKIVAIGQVVSEAGKVVDGSGLITCPGFVDVHSHADLSILQCPAADNLIMQGVTTFIGGNCGISLAPVKNLDYFQETMQTWGLDFELKWKSFGDYLSAVETNGLSVNYLPLVGHNAIRGAVLGKDYQRKATGSEIVEMKRFVVEAMESGCWGLSVGLDAVTPGHYADLDELVELVEVIKDYAGLFTPHTRHHQNQWPAERAGENAYGLYQGPKGEIITGRYHGLLEAIEISRLAGGVKLLIAHLTPAYLVPQPHPAFLDEALAQATLADIIERPRSEGLDISFNVVGSEHSIGSQLPVIESFFSQKLSLPDWLRGMSKDAFVAALKTNAFRTKVKELVDSGKLKFSMINPVTDPYWMDSYRILHCHNQNYEGKSIGEIARQRQPRYITRAVYEESIEVLCDILVDDPNTTWALVQDKREYGVLATFLKHPWGMPCSDVHALPALMEKTSDIFGYGISPTAYGVFPHFIRTIVKEQKVLSLEEAIRKVTSLPIRDVLGLPERGVLVEGAYADVLLFDFDALRDHDDFLNPTAPPEGIQYVFVNGKVALENGRLTQSKNGQVIRRR